jgi:virginiamycin B lyase
MSNLLNKYIRFSITKIFILCFFTIFNAAIAAERVSWKNIPGGLIDIGVGANGTVWGTNKNGNIYRLKSNGETWQQMPGSAVRVDVDPKGNAFVVNKAGGIYQWTGKKWIKIPGGLSDIGVGANGTVWGTNKNGNIYRLKSNGKTWQQMPGSAVRVDVDPKGNAYVVNKAGGIYRWTGKKWIKIPGGLSDIGVGPRGDVWGINKDGGIYKYNGKGGWNKSNGSANKAISVGPKGPWVINKNSKIYTGPSQQTKVAAAKPKKPKNKVDNKSSVSKVATKKSNKAIRQASAKIKVLKKQKKEKSNGIKICKADVKATYVQWNKECRALNAKKHCRRNMDPSFCCSWGDTTKNALQAFDINRCEKGAKHNIIIRERVVSPWNKGKSPLWRISRMNRFGRH